MRADGPAPAVCPTCGRVSTSRHSAYVRTLKDLPALGATVSLCSRPRRLRQLRTTDQHLFDTFKALQATVQPIAVIAQQLGCDRRRLDKWATQSQLPAPQQQHPTPRSAETFREYLRQRIAATLLTIPRRSSMR
jgi:hypothetical protein